MGECIKDKGQSKEGQTDTTQYGLKKRGNITESAVIPETFLN